MNLHKIAKKLIPILRNKYFISLVLFLVWLLFFDHNNLVDRVKDLNHLHQLQKDKTYYKMRIEKDSKRLNLLKTNDKNLEEFAREEYLMKKDNEDIFIIVEEEE